MIKLPLLNNFCKKIYSIIKVTLKISRFILGFITVIAFITFYIWTEKPNYIDKLDNYIVDNSLIKYQEKFEIAINSINKDNVVAIAQFEELLKELESVGRYDNKLYPLKRNVKINLINLYIAEKLIDKAYSFTVKWEQEDKYDLDAKIKYAQVLSKMQENQKKANAYYAYLFDQFYNIQKVAKPYIEFLLKINEKDEAQRILNIYNENTQREYKYTIYFEDLNGSFSADHLLFFNQLSKLRNNRFKVYFNGTFHKLKSLRFDIEKHPADFVISNISVTLITKSKKFNFPIINPSFKHNFTKTGKNEFTSYGKDPYLAIDLPNEVIGYDGELDIIIQFNLTPVQLLFL